MRHRALLLLLTVFLLPARAAEPTGPVDLNSASLERIAGLSRISAEMARTILEARKAKGAFENLGQVRSLPGMTDTIWAAIEPRVRLLAPLDVGKGSEGSVDDDAGGAKIVAVSNFFVKFDGLDLSVLPTDLQAEFLGEMNREECTCGCVGDTIARCYVNDPGCPVARARLHAVYKEMVERAEKRAGTSEP